MSLNLANHNRKLGVFGQKLEGSQSLFDVILWNIRHNLKVMFEWSLLHQYE